MNNNFESLDLFITVRQFTLDPQLSPNNLCGHCSLSPSSSPNPKTLVSTGIVVTSSNRL
ncbi:hypothetical protein JHK86_012829 [Glycine max]|nr:hypothetical protein JHK86_012829 [Glycine max]